MFLSGVLRRSRSFKLTDGRSSEGVSSRTVKVLFLVHTNVKETIRTLGIIFGHTEPERSSLRTFRPSSLTSPVLSVSSVFFRTDWRRSHQNSVLLSERSSSRTHSRDSERRRQVKGQQGHGSFISNVWARGQEVWTGQNPMSIWQGLLQVRPSAHLRRRCLVVFDPAAQEEQKQKVSDGGWLSRLLFILFY